MELPEGAKDWEHSCEGYRHAAYKITAGKEVELRMTQEPFLLSLRFYPYFICNISKSELSSLYFNI